MPAFAGSPVKHNQDAQDPIPGTSGIGQRKSGQDSKKRKIISPESSELSGSDTDFDPNGSDVDQETDFDANGSDVDQEPWEDEDNSQDKCKPEKKRSGVKKSISQTSEKKT